MSDELENLIREASNRFPPLDATLTNQLRETAIRRYARRRWPPGAAPPAALAVAVLAVLALGFSVGRWVVPANGSRAESMSLNAQPRIAVVEGPVDLYGVVPGAPAGEVVTVQSFQCGLYDIWTTADQAKIAGGGAWVVRDTVLTLTRFRARWKNGTSNTVTVQAHPAIQVNPRPGGKLEILVEALTYFDRRVAVLERFSGGAWLRVKSFRLHRTTDRSYPSYSYAVIRSSVRPGTLVRVVLPKSQAGRCYLPGFSNEVKVWK